MFQDRADAGRRLVPRLKAEGVRADLVLGVPRGGVAVAVPVAAGLGLPLDVIVARKIGDPYQPELAIGAVTRFGVVWNADLLGSLSLSPREVEEAEGRARQELERREAMYRRVRAAEPVAGCRAIIVDDGLATGATVAAAVRALQQAGAAAVIVAVPVATEEAVERMRALGARVVALSVPEEFLAVGRFYEHFAPVTDEECLALLQSAAAQPPAGERAEPAGGDG